MRPHNIAPPAGSRECGYVDGYTRAVSQGQRTRICIECGYPRHKHERCSQCCNYAQLYQALELFRASSSRRVR
jgi:hypothetical protein